MCEPTWVIVIGAIITGIISLLGALVAHLVTKDRMNEKFTEQMTAIREHYTEETAGLRNYYNGELAKLRAENNDDLVVLRREFVSRQTCDDCKMSQTERKEAFAKVTQDIKDWLTKVDLKIDTLTANLLKK